jgi:hypothetical protein
MVAQKAAGARKAESVAPPAPPPADASARFADVPAPASADTAGARRIAEARRAIGQRAAAARSERVVTTSVAPQPTERERRGETSNRLQVDTVTVSRTDTVTVVVEAPRPPNLRDPAAPIPAAVIRISGCYEVVEGRFPKAITLTTERMWSGAAEQQFVARARGASGYWSQPRSGDVYIALVGAIANARIDPSTGELRGKVHRGGTSERFVARRCR